MVLNFEDHKDRYEAAVERFKLGEIKENDFVLLLASLGFNATEIDAEINDALGELKYR